jgi:ribosomal protein S6
MADEAMKAVENDAEDAAVTRIYEVGYHISPAAKEEDHEKIVASIRSVIEKAGGSFIAEGAPALTKLSYEIDVREGEKRVSYDRGYFGWIKFEGSIESAQQLEESMKANQSIMRHVVFQTVREDTRAKIKAPQLREVKRTDVIKAAPRRAEENAAPVSEEVLEKALQDLTAE